MPATPFRFVVLVAGTVVVLAALLFAIVLFRAASRMRAREQGRTSATTVDVEAMKPKVVAFCGDCHAYPKPETFPRRAWAEEVAQGFSFYAESGRSDLQVPAVKDVVAYYQQLAPKKLVIPRPPATSSSASIVLRLDDRQSQSASQKRRPAGISHLNWLNLGLPSRVLVVCDMLRGDVLLLKPSQPKAGFQAVARLRSPGHAEACDLDRDGLVDLLVADLGVPMSSDARRGRVVWLRRTTADPPEFETIVLRDGLPRVADIQPADFDGDGDFDLLVAEFGWRKNGRSSLWINQSGKAGRPTFVVRKIDARHGAIHVPPVDLNNDGNIDFVALISQQHETVVAFLNRGDGTFVKKTIFASNNPAFGSSGIQLVDFDQDDDIDILYSNGDSFDSFGIKPYHGIQWLENKGEYPFITHRLTDMPGVMRALAADMDGDGDLDVVAAAALPGNATASLSPGDVDSLIWLEQLEPGRFTRHTVQTDACHYVSLELADFDGDDDLDVGVGNFSDTGPNASPVWVWLNEPTE